MHEQVLRPSAAKLLESMRDIGYSFKSALADIIDNSISANASKISVINGLDVDDKPYVAIVDDGHGMGADELTAAMQHGSRSPREFRVKGDLGRFGLGLKTASFAQCRLLTVTSRKDGVTSARQWSLDLVISSDEWTLRLLNADEIASLPEIGSLGLTGTLVLWQELDRLDSIGDKPAELQDALNKIFHDARRHLALTFHRFLKPEPEDEHAAIELAINGLPVEPTDPFARHMSPRSDSHEVEILKGPLGDIVTQAFTLPHHSRLSVQQLEDLALGASLIETQGLYIYRAKRLIAGGTWLGLASRTDITKLLRVRVDVPTDLDSEWGVDVRKSRIRPPAAVRARLRPLVEQMTESARRPYTYRGTKQATNPGTMPIWYRTSERGAIRYSIDRKHPLLAKALDADANSASAILAMLAAVEAALPLDTIFSDMGSSPKSMTQSTLADAELEAMLAAYVAALAPCVDTLHQSVVSAIMSSPPFAGDQRVMAVLSKLRVIENT
jgi:hypothetical protein